MIKRQYKTIKPAWMLNPENLNGAYKFQTDGVFLGTRGEAKSYFFWINEDATLKETGEDVRYLDIKVKRVKEEDEIEYEGKIIRRRSIARFDRMERIRNLDKDKLYYVQDRRQYVGNAVLWWGRNGNGYVCELSRAHKYSYEELQKFNPRPTDIIWESEHVESATKTIVDMQGLNVELSI